MTTYENLLTGMEAAAREAGELLRNLPRPVAAATFDDYARAWRELEAPVVAVLRDRLAVLRPHVDWTEELDSLAALPADGEVWCVDVVDGAVQFMQGLPQFCVSLTLVRDGRPVAAVLHAPLFGETYLAAHGLGATRDGRPVRPSVKIDTAATIVATSQPPLIARQPEAPQEAEPQLAARGPAGSASGPGRVPGFAGRRRPIWPGPRGRRRLRRGGGSRRGGGRPRAGRSAARGG